jgi:hypothetical protein
MAMMLSLTQMVSYYSYRALLVSPGLSTRCKVFCQGEKIAISQESCGAVGLRMKTWSI